MEINKEELIQAVTNNDWLFLSKYIPDKLYKYRSFDKRYNIENIVNNKIRLTDPHVFNDPYDTALSYYVDFNKSVDSVSFKAFIENNKNSFSKETLPYLEKMVEGATIADIFKDIAYNEGIDEEDTNEMIGFLEKFTSTRVTDIVNNEFKNSSLRICSFTTKNDNMLMWSHYADQHRGFCIEYDISDINQNYEFCRHLYPVIYTQELFKPEKYNINNWAQELIASLFKSKDWEYEEEWRFVEMGGINSDFYKVNRPSAVYFGARYENNEVENKENVDYLNRICDIYGIKKYKMQLSNQEFKMMPQDF